MRETTPGPANDASQIAKLAAHSKWAQCTDRTAATAAARAAFLDHFEKQVDPTGTMDPAARAKAAESAKKAHFARLALRSAQARRAKAARRTTAKTRPAGTDA